MPKHGHLYTSKDFFFIVVGKRNLVVNDVKAAVASLAVASEQYGSLFGESAPECAEAYFYYGKALLELARIEGGVIDNVLDGVPEEQDSVDEEAFAEGPKPSEEEQEKISEQVGEALEENFNELEKLKEKKEDSKTEAAPAADEKAEKDKDDANEKKSEEEAKTEATEDKKDETEAQAEDEKDGEAMEEDAAQGEEDPDDPEEKVDENADGKEENKEEEEDPSNLQLAWEMFELTKVIVTKVLDGAKDKADDEKPSKEELEALETRLSDIFMALGEVSIENEAYEQAVEDLKTCLTRRKEKLPADSRKIAETKYQLGVALGYHAKFDEAVEALNAAIAVLKTRIGNLKEVKGADDDKEKMQANMEIAEIESLIPEIEEKIADTKNMKEESLKKAASGEDSTEEAKANGRDNTADIQGLVKKRKKSDETEVSLFLIK